MTTLLGVYPGAKLYTVALLTALVAFFVTSSCILENRYEKMPMRRRVMQKQRKGFRTVWVALWWPPASSGE